MTSTLPLGKVMRMETLRNYLKEFTADQKPEFEKSVGSKIAYLRKAISINSKLSPGLCMQIEKATNGLVTRKDLRPNDFHIIWPELV